jgi:hypothetical protein
MPAMPKITINEYSDSLLLKNDIGRSWQPLAIPLKTQAQTVKLALN